MNLSKLFAKISRAQYASQWVVFIFDLFLSLVSTLLVLFFIFNIWDIYNDKILFGLIVSSLICSSISILVFKTYKGLIRHSSLTEAGRLAAADLLRFVLMQICYIYFFRENPFWLSILVNLLDFGIVYLLQTSFRSLIIAIYWKAVRQSMEVGREMLICIDEQFMDQVGYLNAISFSGYHVVGYIRYGNPGKMRISDLPVFSIESQEEFNALTRIRHIRAILFPSQEMLKTESDRILRFANRGMVRSLLLPSVDEVKKGKTVISALPEVKIEDLLGRDEIKINLVEIINQMRGKVVMVTGAAGSIGSELCRQLCSFGLKRLILFDSAETPMHNIRLELEESFPSLEILPIIGDVRMPNRLEVVFKRYRPNYIFHAAAYKHVPLMEENPCEAVHTNVYGTRNVANMAVKYGVEKFIMISTDKAVNPTNVMGASKRLAEIYVQSLSIAISKKELEGKTRFITTRFGNVLGSNGSVIPRFRSQLAKGGPLTVTHPDIIRYFMTIPEACRLVLEAAYLGQGDEIFVFDMGTPVKIADLAKRMIELSGLVPNKDIDIIYTGLRPGEKLYEELLATKENTLPTENKKIFRAQVREYDYFTVNKEFDNLIEYAVNVRKMDTVRCMKQIIPEFKSKNSIYEELDQDSEL